jgi:hypothetical protein
MIGVLARAEDRDTVREFFELFKTPWEFCRAGTAYDVVINATREHHHPSGQVVIAYEPDADSRRGGGAIPAVPRTTLTYNGAPLPIYGRHVALDAGGPAPSLSIDGTGTPAIAATWTDGAVHIRVGYDLFREVGILLTTGQPATHAALPTLERHIALLRECIVGAGLPLVEIPPIPHGHRFVVCLTHDLDHPSIRRHGWDHTVAGFFYRATVGSVKDLATGRTSVRAVARNLSAALRLPLIHMGLAHDFWSDFTRYLDVEHGIRATYFSIPVPHQPGRTLTGQAPAFRASVYGAADIGAELQTILGSGSEVALHGIDAWLDATAGAEERATVAAVTGASVAGSRMHWLYWSEESPRHLEQAGFSYDSTVGYNDTIGFRAGTAQAFTPRGAQRLLEIPLTIMDTALFYPPYLGLTQQTAGRVVWPIVDSVERHGGVLTVNWHDRSLAPERLWDTFYGELLDGLKRRAPWFAPMREAAAWFRRRRSATFESVRWTGDSVAVVATAPPGDHLPDLTIRVHEPGAANLMVPAAWSSPDAYRDFPFREAAGSVDVVLSPTNKLAAVAGVIKRESVTS